MTVQTAAFWASLLFLVGIIMTLAGSFPAIRVRYPQLLMHGFLVALSSIGLMVIAAFVLG